jgi:hypothetical protein
VLVTPALFLQNTEKQSSILASEKEMEEFTKEVPVDTWLSAVCGVNLGQWAKIIKEKDWIHDSQINANLREFCNAPRETDCYVPLSNLIMRLIALAQAEGKSLSISGPPPVEDILFYRNDPSIMRELDEHGSLAAARKPDILATQKEEKKHTKRRFDGGLGVQWAKTLFYIELKYDTGSGVKLSAKLEDKLSRKAQKIVRLAPFHPTALVSHVLTIFMFRSGILETDLLLYYQKMRMLELRVVPQKILRHLGGRS